MASEQAQHAAETQEPGKPDEEKLQKSVIAARKVVEAQDAAAALKDRAMNAVNPKERLRLLQEAYDKEVEAWGQSKYAKRLQSGAWQGGVAGGGIGGAVAMGLGTVVGTLVSGLVAVPTVALGTLVGAGVGTFHGPFLNFGKKDGKSAATTERDSQSAAMAEARRLDDAVERGASTVPRRPQLEPDPSDESRHQDTAAGEDQATVKRKPRKLQDRSQNIVNPPPERRKPRKIQVRSAAEAAEHG